MPTVADALAELKVSRYQRAEKLFAELESEPSARIEVLGHRGWMLRSLGRFEEARRDFQALSEENPADLTARALLADAMRLCGDLDGAARTAVLVLAEEPFHTLAGVVLRSCQEARGLSAAPAPKEPGPGNVPPHVPWNAGIAAIEHAPSSYPASLYPEVGRFLYAFVRAVRPGVVIEAGAFIGLSSLCIAQGLEENGYGHLHSFDIFADRPGWVSPVIGPCEDALTVARAHSEHGGMSHRVTFTKGDSSTKIAEVFAGKQSCADLAFIDGDHTIKGAMRDWEAVHPLLKEGGFILLHDTVPERCGWLGPRYLMEELGRRWPGAYRWVNVPTPEGYGLGIIQKTETVPAKSWRPPLMELIFERLYLHRVERSQRKQE